MDSSKLVQSVFKNTKLITAQAQWVLFRLANSVSEASTVFARWLYMTCDRKKSKYEPHITRSKAQTAFVIRKQMRLEPVGRAMEAVEGGDFG